MTALQLNNKLKIIIWVIQSLFLAVIILSAFNIVNSGKSYNKTKLELKQKENRLNYLLALKEEYEKNSKYKEDITEALPTEKEVSNFLYTISALSKNYGVTVNRIDFPITKVTKSAALNFKSNIELSSNNVIGIENLIKEIENNKRIMDITSLSIKKLDIGYSANLSIIGYYKK